MSSDPAPDSLKQRRSGDLLNELAGRTRSEFKENAVVWFVVFIIGAASGAYTLWVNVASSAKSAVTSETFLAELAKRIRPTRVFTTKGTTEFDSGVANYIRHIQIEPVPKEFGYRITLEATRHLAYAPLITSVDANLYSTSVERKPSDSWTYLMVPNPNTKTFVDDTMNTNMVFRFKLEILH